MTAVSPQSGSVSDDVPFLTDAGLFADFLASVSHDLRSPLLALALTDNPTFFSVAEREHFVREATREIERMLDAVKAIAVARSTQLAVQLVALRDLLHGHVLISDATLAPSAAVLVDPAPVRDAFLALCADVPLEVRLDAREAEARVTVALPALFDPFVRAGRLAIQDDPPTLTDSPLHALLAWLKRYAGTPVGALAAAQVQLARQGGDLRCVDGQLVLRLPLAPVDASR